MAYPHGGRAKGRSAQSTDTGPDDDASRREARGGTDVEKRNKERDEEARGRIFGDPTQKSEPREASQTDAEEVRKAIDGLSDDQTSLKEVLKEYPDVFPTDLPRELPPHCPWDITIPLKDGTKPVLGRCTDKVRRSWRLYGSIWTIYSSGR